VLFTVFEMDAGPIVGQTKVRSFWYTVSRRFLVSKLVSKLIFQLDFYAGPIVEQIKVGTSGSLTFPCRTRRMRAQ
jgi:hypothetical protein